MGGSELITTYTYNFAITTLLIMVAIFTSGVGLYCADLFVQNSEWWAAAASPLILFFAVFLWLAVLLRVDISINDRGISASLLGLRMRRLDWRNVKSIQKLRVASGYGFYTNRFNVCSESDGFLRAIFVNAYGNIAFGEDIRCLRQLLDQINLYADRYSIPIFVWDLENNGNDEHTERGLQSQRRVAKL